MEQTVTNAMIATTEKSEDGGNNTHYTLFINTCIKRTLCFLLILLYKCAFLQIKILIRD